MYLTDHSPAPGADADTTTMPHDQTLVPPDSPPPHSVCSVASSRASSYEFPFRGTPPPNPYGRPMPTRRETHDAAPNPPHTFNFVVPQDVQELTLARLRHIYAQMTILEKKTFYGDDDAWAERNKSLHNYLHESLFLQDRLAMSEYYSSLHNIPVPARAPPFSPYHPKAARAAPGRPSSP